MRNPHATSHLITQSLTLMKQTSLRSNATSIAHGDRQFVALDEKEGTKQGTIRSSPPQQTSPSYLIRCCRLRIVSEQWCAITVH